MKMMSVMILVVVLLASSLGRANAAGMDVPAFESDVTNCGYEPICGYIQAHSPTQPVVKAASLAERLAENRPLAALEQQLVFNQAALVHSGPGSNFYSYGELPTTFASRVLGISRNGGWWVILLPLDVAPDGLGWVDAAAVSAKNIYPDQVNPPACEGQAICGYLKAHNSAVVQDAGPACTEMPICGYLMAHQQRIPVFEPTYVTEWLFGQPVVAVTGICKPATSSDC